ncbi:hypothetical protein ACSBR2_008455 [Camellia fascicularis]
MTTSRFSFVRYNCEVVAKVAVQKANGLWVEDKALVVKSADFKREKKQKGYVQPQEKRQRNERNSGEEGWRPRHDIVIQVKRGNEFKVKDVKEMIGDWCEDAVTWEAGLVLEQKRSVWINCYGIPLNLWNRTNMNKIGRLWGEIICYEDELCQQESFTSGKMQIYTKCMELINKVVNLECKWVVYPVRVCEEQRVVVQTIKEECVCKKHMHLADDYSTNDQAYQFMNEKSREGEKDDNRANESTNELKENDEVDREKMSNGLHVIKEADKRDGREE